MKRNRKWTIPACVLALTILCGGVAVAAGGDENDPLITLSYLEEIFLPQVTEQVKEDTAPLQEKLEETFTQQIDTYKKELEEVVSSSAGDSGSASFVLVDMTKGQVMSLDLGAEVMLRVGNARVDSGVNPALIDISTGGTLNKGSSLTKNHLYMASMVDRTITATADSVKLLVRGGYTIG